MLKTTATLYRFAELKRIMEIHCRFNSGFRNIYGSQNTTEHQHQATERKRKTQRHKHRENVIRMHWTMTMIDTNVIDIKSDTWFDMKIATMLTNLQIIYIYWERFATTRCNMHSGCACVLISILCKMFLIILTRLYIYSMNV